MSNLFESFNLSKTDFKILSSLLNVKLINLSQLEVTLKSWQNHGTDVLETLIKYNFINQIQLEEFILKNLGISKAIIPNLINPDAQYRQKGIKFLTIFEDENNLHIAARDFIDIEASAISSKTITVFYIDSKTLNFNLEKRKFNQSKALKLCTRLNAGIINIRGISLTDVISIKDPVVELAEAIIEEAIIKNYIKVNLILNESFLLIKPHNVMLLKEVGVKLISRFKILSGINHEGEGEFYINTFMIKCKSYRDSNCEILNIKVINKMQSPMHYSLLGLNHNASSKVLKAINGEYGISFFISPNNGGKATTLYSFANYLKDIFCVYDVEEKFNLPNSIKGHHLEGFTSVIINPKDLNLLDSIQKGFVAITAYSLFDLINQLSIKKDSILQKTNIIINQRLLNALCDKCKIESPLTKDDLATLKLYKTDVKIIYTACKDGCLNCDGGYNGRSPVFEVIPIEGELLSLLLNQRERVDIYDYFKRKNITTIFEEVRLKILQGLLDIDQIHQFIY